MLDFPVPPSPQIVMRIVLFGGILGGCVGPLSASGGGEDDLVGLCRVWDLVGIAGLGMGFVYRADVGCVGAGGSGLSVCMRLDDVSSRGLPRNAWGTSSTPAQLVVDSFQKYPFNEFDLPKFSLQVLLLSESDVI